MTHAVDSNPWAELNRQKKAEKLADYLCTKNAVLACAEAYNPDDPREAMAAVVADLERADSKWWAMLAGAAGCTVPSERTIALTISLVRQKSAASADERRSAADPFDDLERQYAHEGFRS